MYMYIYVYIYIYIYVYIYIYEPQAAENEAALRRELAQLRKELENNSNNIESITIKTQLIINATQQRLTYITH